jgi:siroheme synthase
VETRWNLPGKIYLVEAGSAKRLTVRAEEALQRADVVFHSEAVPGEVLEMVPSWTAVYNVEKADGIEHFTDEEIKQRVIAAARSGQTVVCLRAGASPIFGQTQNEIRVLREAGIEVEIVADVTAKAEEVIELYRAEDSGIEASNDIRV